MQLKPGKYNTRGMGVATILCRNPVDGQSHPWIGVDSDGSVVTWTEDGKLYADDSEWSYDIISEYNEPQTKEVELVWFKGQYDGEYVFALHGNFGWTPSCGTVISRERVTLTEGRGVEGGK